MSYDNHFLFSETYLNSILKKMKKDDLAEADEQFENILSWYREYKDAWELFEDIMIDTLGYTKEPDGQFRILYSDNTEPVAAAYLLDKDSDVGSTVKGKYYAVDAVQYAREKKIDWAIVTNGTAWRLYNTNNVSPYEFYYESDISDALKNGKSDENTHVFYRMFSAAFYFHNENQTCLMDVFKEESDSENEKIEDILRSKAESILKGLCYGLKDNMNLSVFDESTRKQIYDDAIVLLYRLLFLGYAEARKLLPVTKDDPEYQDSFSNLCQTARDYYMSGRLDSVGNDYDLWDRLDSQLRVYVDKNYNGGLFSNEDKPILREYRIANKHLAVCLMELAYIGGRRNTYDQRIEYKDLSVRNLGAIYEGLLEYQLFIADELMVQRKSKDKVSYVKASEVRLTNSDRNNLVQPGEIYLSQDATERKETGAYYTPEDVVEYIVSQTVDKKLAELKNELDQELAELRDELSYEPVEQNRIMLQHEIDEKTEEFIRGKVLDMSIVDSAMGSGHFLVNAAYHVSNYIVNLLEENHWENEEVNADVTYWKRKVVENCIYGIDINNLSVLLARLSLWLISASNDKALSFIDHHLKCGNSIVGATLNQVQIQNIDYPLLSVTKEDYMFPVLHKYEKIREIGSNTKEDVLRQHRLYDEITADLKIIRRKLDYYLASMYAGEISDKEEFYRVLTASDMDDLERDEFKALFKYADDNKFFHWEIEFPDIYMRGGFDVYIGNPPYVEADCSGYISIKETANCHNLYTYIIERTFAHSSPKSVFGVILPSACVSTPRMDDFQKYLIKETNDVSFAVFDDRPGKLFQRLQHMRAAIIIGHRGQRQREEIKTTKYIRWFSEERKDLFKNIQYVDTPYYKLVKGNIPKVGDPMENDIIGKLFSKSKTINDYIDESETKNGMYYGYGVQYWIKAMCMSAADIDGNARKSTGEKNMHFKKEYSSKIFTLILNSNLFYWYFVLFSDCRNLTRTVISRMPIDLAELSAPDINDLCLLTDDLMDDYIKNSTLKRANYSGTGELVYREYSVRKSKSIIDKADEALGRVYGLSNDEIHFIQNYDVRFRLGDDD